MLGNSGSTSIREMKGNPSFAFTRTGNRITKITKTINSVSVEKTLTRNGDNYITAVSAWSKP